MIHAVACCRASFFPEAGDDNILACLSAYFMHFEIEDRFFKQCLLLMHTDGQYNAKPIEYVGNAAPSNI